MQANFQLLTGDSAIAILRVNPKVHFARGCCYCLLSPRASTDIHRPGLSAVLCDLCHENHCYTARFFPQFIIIVYALVQTCCREILNVTYKHKFRAKTLPLEMYENTNKYKLPVHFSKAKLCHIYYLNICSFLPKKLKKKS